MDAYYSNGFMLFETDHFSYYAVVEEALPCKLTIKSPSTTTVNYGYTLVLHANVENLPGGAKIVWSANNGNFSLSPSNDGLSCSVKSNSSGNTTVTAKVIDKNGNVLSEANQSLTSKAGFFQKLIAFFKNLFKRNMVIANMIRM